MIIKKSRQHLIDSKEGYFKHGLFAVKNGVRIMCVGMISIIHGVIPAYFPFHVPKLIMGLARLARERYPFDDLDQWDTKS